MRIGIYFGAYKSSGGVYQYSLVILEAFREVPENEYVIFNTSSDFPFEHFSGNNWKIVNLVPIAKKTQTGGSDQKKTERLGLKRVATLKILDILRFLRLYRLELYIANRKAGKRATVIDKEKVDLIFYPQPSDLSFLSKTPAVVAVHSLQHRLQERFPEVTQKGQFMKREFTYSNISKSARKIIVDSATTRDDMIRFYHTAPDKFEILPYLPPDYITEKITNSEKQTLERKYGLPKRFVFYPAQFWPHKNHLRLLEALAILKKRGVQVPLVLSGSLKPAWGVIEQLQKHANEYHLENQIWFVGYISNEELNVFYHRAEALVCPTFFGPTPIPLIEAWKAGCPVVYSRLRGSHERAESAAILFDPLDPKDMADQIEKVWTDETVRKDLIAKGSLENAKWTKQDFIEEVKQILGRSLQ